MVLVRTDNPVKNEFSFAKKKLVGVFFRVVPQEAREIFFVQSLPKNTMVFTPDGPEHPIHSSGRGTAGAREKLSGSQVDGAKFWQTLGHGRGQGMETRQDFCPQVAEKNVGPNGKGGDKSSSIGNG